MVKQVTMYEAEDGSVHRCKADALRANAYRGLCSLFSEDPDGPEVATVAIDALLNNCHEVERLLEPLAKELPQAVGEMEAGNDS